MARDFEEAYAKYLEWNRENNGRLYYVLWILFLGGFVYTLQLRPVAGCLQHLGLALFRLLAITGTVLNFLYQENAIDSLGKLREQLKEDDSHKSCSGAHDCGPQCLTEPHYANARSRQCDAERLGRGGNILQVSLRSVTYAYLAFALVLSFLLFPV